MIKRRKKKKRKDKMVLFKTKNKDLKKIRRRRKRKSLQEKFSFRRVVFLIIIFALIFGLIYALLLLSSSQIKEAEEVETSTVLGLDEVPTYEHSVFLYADNLENESVKDMLSSGESAYKIINRKTFEDVKSFYANELTSKGWSLVMDVDVGAEDKKHGQYWVKNDSGLRIYTKYKDIWYEYITPEEAESGLSNRVSQEIEINMLLAGSDYQELLPDYPWQIKIPKDYLIRYEVSEFEELRAVNFQRISTGRFITIYPIGYWGAKELDYQLEDYIDILNKGTEEWVILNTTVTTFQNNRSLNGTIEYQGNQRETLMLKNSSNFVTYILSTEDSTDPLYQYIIDNIKYLGQESP